MFGIGGWELVLILIFAFLILGPDKLPEIAKTAGKAIARFRDAQKDMNEVLKENDLVDARTGQVPSNPVDMIDRVAKVAESGKGEEVVQKVTSAAAAAATSVMRSTSEGDDDAVESSEGGSAAGSDTSGGSASQDESKPMSFAERKARYERERAAREAAKVAAAGEQAADAAEAAAGEAAEAAETAEAVAAEATEAAEAVAAEVAEAAPVEGGDA